MCNTLKTVIIAHPGARQESLRAFLAATKGIELVGIASGALTGWRMVSALSPDLAIIGGGLPEPEVSLLLKNLNDSAGQVLSLVIASTQRQAQAARAAGVSAVLVGDISFAEFGRVLSELIAVSQRTL